MQRTRPTESFIFRVYRSSLHVEDSHSCPSDTEACAQEDCVEFFSEEALKEQRALGLGCRRTRSSELNSRSHSAQG